MDVSVQRVISYIRYRRQQQVTLPESSRQPLRELLSLLAPRRAKDHLKIRVGSGRDGSYVMLDDFQKIEVALSLGIGPDVSWDWAIAERGIPVRQYDHTVQSPPLKHPLFTFEARRITDQRTGPQELPLAELLTSVADKASILKVDIEGDEWTIFSQLDPALLQNCRQITVEFHHFVSIGNPAWRNTARKALLTLSQDFGVVHLHGNNLSKHLNLGSRKVPDSLEVTFANRRFYDLAPTDETFPGPLDRKNNLFFPDFHLGRFDFST